MKKTRYFAFIRQWLVNWQLIVMVVVLAKLNSIGKGVEYAPLTPNKSFNNFIIYSCQQPLIKITRAIHNEKKIGTELELQRN